MEAKHTAGPWIKVEGDRFSKEVAITTLERINSRTSPICEMDVNYTGQMGIEQPANAEFIVRACNSHERLVQALTEAERIISTALREGQFTGASEAAKQNKFDAQGSIGAIRAILAAAGAA